MALPSLSKNWTFNTNKIISASANDDVTFFKNLWFNIKKYLTLSGNWLVQKSSNGSTVSNTDLWLDADSLIYFNGSASVNIVGSRSWIILRNPSLGSNFDICIDMIRRSGNGGPSTGRLAIAPNGFNLETGSSSTIPSTNVANDILYGYQTSGTYSSTYTAQSYSYLTLDTGTAVMPYRHILHVLQSTDGQCTRIILCCRDSVRAIVILDKPNTKVTSSNWNIPFIYGVCSLADPYSNWIIPGDPIASGYPTDSFWLATRFLSSAGSSWSYLTSNYLAGTYYPGYSSYPLQSLLTYKNDYNSSYPISSISISSQNYPYRGWHGGLYDMWIGSIALPSGITYPSNDSKQFAQFNINNLTDLYAPSYGANQTNATISTGIVMPWDGSSYPLLR